MHNRAPPNVTVPHMNQQRPRPAYQNMHPQPITQQQQPHPPHPQHPHAAHGQPMVYHPHDQAMPDKNMPFINSDLPMSQVIDLLSQSVYK